MYDYIYIHICVYVYTTFPLYVFGVCLLCVGVKTDTKRDVALQGEKHKKEKGELEHDRIFLRTQRK